jgi:hypothetical protein
MAGIPPLLIHAPNPNIPNPVSRLPVPKFPGGIPVSCVLPKGPGAPGIRGIFLPY